MGWDGMDGSPGGPRYRAPTVLINSKEDVDNPDTWLPGTPDTPG